MSKPILIDREHLPAIKHALRHMAARLYGFDPEHGQRKRQSSLGFLYAFEDALKEIEGQENDN